MFSGEVKTLLENANNVILNVMNSLEEDLGEVFSVV
jgi:hypothetical protein